MSILDIKELPVHPDLIKILNDDGIQTLFPPQVEAINKGLLEGNNIVVAIPTASGKTLLALMAITSTLRRYPGAKAIYLAPLKALAGEKYQEFSKYTKELGYKVAISTGDLDETSTWLAKSDIIIVTNEKFDSLIRHGVSWLNEIKVVVSDEVHLIHDGSRGPVLEVVLTLIRRNLIDCQIIALSATISNAQEISEWLDAELIFSTWRPIKLKEGVWFNGKITYSDGSTVAIGNEKMNSSYISLALDIVQQNAQCLIFTNSRNSSMATAEQVGINLNSILSKETKEYLTIIAKKIQDIGENTKLRERLVKTVKKGVAFHHAGLISAHRRIIEEEFKARNIKVITSTPTLAAGINLPGRRVIIRTLSRYAQGFGQTFIPVLEYKQMAGRAGRPRYDPYGEAIVIANAENDIDTILNRYVRADSEEIYSKLGAEPALRSHILAFISAEYVDSIDSVFDIISDTFYGYQNDGQLYFIEENVINVIEILADAKLITPNEPYKITPFGKRITELYLDPLSARIIKRGLDKSQNKNIPNIVYLQLLTSTPDIHAYSIRKSDFPYLLEIAGEYEEQWLDEGLVDNTEFDRELFFASLKVACIIEMWLSEATEEDINGKFGVSSGDLHNIIQTAKWLLHSSIEISKLFKYKEHQQRLEIIISRLSYGISKELLPLVEIQGIGRVRARTLFNAGYKNKDDILTADIESLSKLSGIGKTIANSIKIAIQTGSSVPNISQQEEDDTQTNLNSFFG